MKLTFLGGAGEVGRTCMVLDDGKKIMLDCGIKLGEKTEYPNVTENVDVITLSHAHLDHCGYLPFLNFDTKIITTKPTRDLMGILISDYQRIKRSFSIKDVENTLKKTEIVDYYQTVNSSYNITLLPAGHIMGSAITLVQKGDRSIVYSGDICMRKTRILDPCKKNIDADTLIVETTYGGKNDILPSHKESYHKMIEIINSTIDNGGHVIIPSFAVGRAQEILLALDDYMRSGALKPTKIFIDGMIGKAMKIYRHNAIYANDDIKKRILMSEDDPFKSPNFHRSRSKERVDVISEPCIIVTTSGMLSGGPIIFYLEKLGKDPKNTLIFVGYQAEGTQGRKIMNGERKLIFEEKEIELGLRIESVRISGHADFNELLQFIKSFNGLKKVFLMHGEKTDLVEYLEKDYDVFVPKNNETFNI